MGCSKSVLRGNFIVTQAFLKKKEKSQIHNLTYHIKELETEEQTNLKSAEEKK